MSQTLTGANRVREYLAKDGAIWLSLKTGLWAVYAEIVCDGIAIKSVVHVFEPVIRFTGLLHWGWESESALSSTCRRMVTSPLIKFCASGTVSTMDTGFLGFCSVFTWLIVIYSERDSTVVIAWCHRLAMKRISERCVACTCQAIQNS